MHRFCAPSPEDSIKEVFDRFFATFDSGGEAGSSSEAGGGGIDGQGESTSSRSASVPGWRRQTTSARSVADLGYRRGEDSEAHDAQAERAREGRRRHEHGIRGRCDEVKQIVLEAMGDQADEEVYHLLDLIGGDVDEETFAEAIEAARRRVRDIAQHRAVPGEGGTRAGGATSSTATPREKPKAIEKPKVGVKVQRHSKGEHCKLHGGRSMVFSKVSVDECAAQAQACFAPVIEHGAEKKPPRVVINLQEQLALPKPRKIALMPRLPHMQTSSWIPAFSAVDNSSICTGRPTATAERGSTAFPRCSGYSVFGDGGDEACASFNSKQVSSWVPESSVVDNSSTCTGPSTATAASSSTAFSCRSEHSVVRDGGDEASTSSGVRVQRHSKFNPSQLDTEFTDARRLASHARCKSAKALRGASFVHVPQVCSAKEGLEKCFQESQRNCFSINDKVSRRTVTMHYQRGGHNPSQNTSVQDEFRSEPLDEQIDYRFEAGVKPDIVRLHIEAKRLEGSGGQFRDAQVVFQESLVSFYAVDRGGKSWTFRSTPLPGTIVTEECCFQVDKTGEELSITLKKANSTEHWEKDQITITHRVAHESSSCSECHEARGEVDVVGGAETPLGSTPPSQRQSHQGASSTRSVLKLHRIRAPEQNLEECELADDLFSPRSPISLANSGGREAAAHDATQLGRMFT